ncbi:MAG: hypothetical protein IIC76_00850 [Bacteroidetes bacterium]|nr:hypothetical protein [Bacteroidota bacterium]
MKYLVFILSLMFLISCDIFNTRDAAEPDEGRSDYLTASEPGILIQNLMNSFSDKDVVNYKNSFVTGFSNKVFSFLPSGTALSTYSNIWPTWDLDSEEEYFNNLKNTAPDDSSVTLKLSLSLESFGIILGDSLKYASEYSINVPQINSDARNYQGNLEFSMTRESGSVWVIYFWKDNAVGNNSSWSDLKGESVN